MGGSTSCLNQDCTGGESSIQADVSTQLYQVGVTPPADILEAKPIIPNGLPAHALVGLENGNLEEGCVLAWLVCDSEQDLSQEDRFVQFHAELATVVNLFGARILEQDASQGIIHCKAMESQNLTAVDVAARLGQVLCRWAMTLQPQFGLFVGVHVGSLKEMKVPTGDRTVYLGQSIFRARKLAEASQQVMMVHLSNYAKERLKQFEQVPLLLSLDRMSYYLDPMTEVSRRIPQKTELVMGRMNSDVTKIVALGTAATHTSSLVPVSEFSEKLASYGVDVDCFGHDGAISISKFHEQVEVVKKDHLVQRGNRLERFRCLLRVKVRYMGDDMQTWELRVASSTEDAMPGITDGIMDNMPVVVHLSPDEAQGCTTALEKFLENHLLLSPANQKRCCESDLHSHSMREEPVVSRSIPGMKTTVRVLTAVVNLSDRTKPELRPLGLPNGNDFQTNGIRWTWEKAFSRQNEDLLFELLYENDVDLGHWTRDDFHSLYDEIFYECSATLEKRDGMLTRTIRIIKVWLTADVLSHTYVLVVSSKTKNGKNMDGDKNQPPSMKMTGEDWEVAVEMLFEQRIGISPEDQKKFFSMDMSSYKFTEEVAYSRSFPGLRTIYLVSEVLVTVKMSDDNGLQKLGLPNLVDFSFERGEGRDSVVTQWGWKPLEELPPLVGRQLPASMSPKNRQHLIRGVTDAAFDRPKQHIAMEREPKRKAPTPETLTETQGADPKLPLLARLMKGVDCDWKRAKNAATKICSPDYTARMFHDDCAAAFPELRLYVIQSETTSGRVPDEEYQRTIGAMFAVFWLMRMHLDGKECFCFGLNDDWTGPREVPQDATLEEEEEWTKRKRFLEMANWAKIEDLFVQGGLLLKPKQGKHDVERTLALLVLMAMHDIMKIAVLLPEVEKKVGNYRGYKVGEKISDHDAGLSYFMQYYSSYLPSFAKLGKGQQASIRFAHSKMDYNMGWLVQAEAPPGALFRTFRKVIISGQAKPQDVAFYFAHWLTDLAGAEPFPVDGCEKFVLKFPLPVLNQFLDSFAIVKSLSKTKTETQVFESYLQWRWGCQKPSLGPPPVGPGAIAKMRLVVMGQCDNSMKLVDTYDTLDEADRLLLNTEMAMTGCAKQAYECDPPGHSLVGPAILIYYAPALMQKVGKTSPRFAFRVLAEVFRKARNIWPACMEDEDKSIIIRIDTLKEMELNSLKDHDSSYLWVLAKTSEVDGAVKQVPVSAIKDLDWNLNQVLLFSPQSRAVRHDSMLSSQEQMGFSRGPSIKCVLSGTPSVSMRETHTSVGLRSSEAAKVAQDV